MAAELGFEPRHTESESAVLPLHNSARYMLAVWRLYIVAQETAFVNSFLKNIYQSAKLSVIVLPHRAEWCFFTFINILYF